MRRKFLQRNYQSVVKVFCRWVGQQYTSAEAAVGSIQAGVDIVLGPRYFTEAFDAVMAAVNNGTISEERINQSVRRILKLRKEMKR